MTKRREQLIEFHQAAAQPVLDRPQVPPDDRVRLRLKLVTEEALELVEACMGPAASLQVQSVRDMLGDVINNYPVKADLVGVADALEDIDYVVEGSRLEFGINGEPLADEVHRSNMAKFGPGSWKREDGKIMKPPRWRPPDLKRELRKQGWKG